MASDFRERESRVLFTIIQNTYSSLSFYHTYMQEAPHFPGTSLTAARTLAWTLPEPLLNPRVPQRCCPGEESSIQQRSRLCSWRKSGASPLSGLEKQLVAGCQPPEGQLRSVCSLWVGWREEILALTLRNSLLTIRAEQALE